MASREVITTLEATYGRQCHQADQALQRASAHHGILAVPDLQLAAAHLSEAAGTANIASMVCGYRDQPRWSERRGAARRTVTWLHNDITTLVADCLRSAAA